MPKRRVTNAVIVEGRCIQFLLEAGSWKRRWKEKNDGEGKKMQIKCWWRESTQWFLLCGGVWKFVSFWKCANLEKTHRFWTPFLVKSSLISQNRAGQPKFKFQTIHDATNVYRMIPKTNARYAVYVWEHYTKSQNIYGFERPPKFATYPKAPTISNITQ
jgi:hypothetical protein